MSDHEGARHPRNPGQIIVTLKTGRSDVAGPRRLCGLSRAMITEHEQEDALSTPSHADGLSGRHPLALGIERQSRALPGGPRRPTRPDHSRVQWVPRPEHLSGLLPADSSAGKAT